MARGGGGLEARERPVGVPGAEGLEVGGVGGVGVVGGGGAAGREDEGEQEDAGHRRGRGGGRGSGARPRGYRRGASPDKSGTGARRDGRVEPRARGLVLPLDLPPPA